MHQCHFCSRWYQSRQSVRAHLRWCAAYKAHKAVAQQEGRQDAAAREPEAWKCSRFGHRFGQGGRCSRCGGAPSVQPSSPG